MADGILFLFGGAGYLAPVALFAAGAVVMLRPMLPAVQPWGLGALCLGRCAHARPRRRVARPRAGRHPARRLPRRRSTCAQHGGLVGESLFWVTSHLFSHAGSHILFVFLLLAGVLLLTGASVAGVVERHAAGRGHHHRAGAGLEAGPGERALGPHHGAARPAARARRWRRPSRRTRSRWCARPTWRRPRSTPRSATRTSTRTRSPRRRSRSARPRPEPEPEPEPAPEPLPEPEPAGRGGARAHAAGPPALGGHRVGRHRLPDAEAVVPQALERSPEGRHEGHRARGRASSSRRSATSTSTRG